MNDKDLNRLCDERLAAGEEPVTLTLDELRARRAHHPNELPSHMKDAVRDARMAPEHKHLDALMQPDQGDE
jgi:hypothetical protein